MTKNAKRFLRRHVCGWCDQNLDKDDCLALFEKCSAATRAKRRAKCLQDYKPRKRAA